MYEEIEALYREKSSKQAKALAGRVGGLYNAEDIVQEAYCRALKHCESFDGGKASLEVWLQRIIKRCTYDFKRQELQQGLVRDEMEKDEPFEDFRGLGISTMKEVVGEIDGRPEAHQQVLRLTFIKGYRPREIAEIVEEGSRGIEHILRRFKLDMLAKYSTG
jgi:RNA polymerase sigma factor (sigma-70 family)